MENLLYFPYISIQKSPWLCKTLLYSDTIHTITPIEYLDFPNKFEEHMQLLIREGLVKQFSPSAYIHHISNFEGNFIKLIRRNYLSNSNDQNTRIPIDDYSYTKIHLEKMNYRLGSFLREEGLAYRGNGKWLLVRQDIARDFMNYLAILIGNNSELTPATDSMNYISPIYNEVRTPFSSENTSNEDNIQKSAIRTHILEGVFSIPLDITSDTHKIIDFKQKNNELLLNFRRLIEKTVSDTYCFSEEKQRLRIDDSLKEINEEKILIREKMSRYWSVGDFGSLIWLTPTASLLSNTNIEDSLLTTLAYSTTIAKGGFDVLKRGLDNRKSLNNNPLAYVIKAEKHFGVLNNGTNQQAKHKVIEHI